MLKPKQYWLNSIGFVVIYWGVAQLSMLLAIQPGNVTPVYPPAGMAWALILLNGNKALPLIFVAGFISNWTPLVSSMPILSSLSAGLIIGMGEVMAVYVANWLFTRFANSNIRLDTPIAVLIFSSIAICWFVSPAVGVTGLYLTGILESSALANAYLTWWLGDSIGVLLMTPLILFAFQSRGAWRQIWLNQFFSKLLVSLVTLSLSLLFFFSEYPAFYLLTLLLLLSGFFLHQLELALANVVIASVGLFAVLSGHGFMAQGEPLTELMMVQLFVGANLIASLLQWSHIEQIKKLGIHLDDANYKAREDRLTQVLNRRGFEEYASERMSRHDDTRGNCYLLIFDIDNFKRINDEFGHDAGDVVLKTITMKVLHCIRKSDIFGRFGGEEFVLYFEQPSDQLAVKLAKRILKSTRDIKLNYEQKSIPQITVSIGLVQINVNDTLHASIRKADKLLYQAKAEGKNRVVSAMN